MPYLNSNYTTSSNGASFNTGTGGVDSSVTGSVTATLTWQPATGQTPITDPPPTQPVPILEIATAQENPGSWYGGPVPTSAGTVSNGLGDSPVALGRGYIAKGSHLIQRDGSSGVITLAPVSMSAACPKTTVVNGKIDWQGSQAVSVRLNVVLDTRSINIVRDGARTLGKVYSPDGQLHGEYVDASGGGHGETVYSAQPPNWQNFHVNFFGSWSQKPSDNILSTGTIPDVAWAWTPNESEDTWYTGKCEMPNSNITYNADGTESGKAASPTTYPVTYTATDNGDGAKASAAYTLVVHEQWDNLRLDPAHPFDVVDNTNPVQINGQNYPVQMNLDYNTPAPVGPLTLGGTIGLQFSAQLNGSFKLSDFFTLGGNFTATGSIAVTANQAITSAPIPPRCYIQLMYEVHYHTNHWLTDHYLPSGYDFTYTQLIDDQKDAVTSLYWGHPIQLAGSGLGGGS